MAARGPRIDDGVWNGVYYYVFGHSRQLSLNRYFDPSTPSMRKGCDQEEVVEEKNSETSGSLLSCQSTN